MDPEMDIDGLDHKEPEIIDDASQPMEGVTTGEGVAIQSSDPLKGEYTWEIPNFSERPAKIFSDVFEVGGFSWQLLCFPKGNKPGQLSLFLAVPDIDEQPVNWQRSASFKLSVLSALGPEHNAVKETQHTFQGMENDWGFNNFISRAELENAARGLLNEDTIRVKVEIEVRVPEDFSYDSRKETGYVGLKNQGATCYMNSLLQTLYNINQFRKAVYHMPTSEDDEPSSSMPLALQSLQFTDGPVSTKDLTRSFGWDTNDAFQQHDVQELNRILCDRLEEKMKGTRVEGTISKLFEGHTLNYIDCINVDYKSTRRESFMDLQLDVKGCKNVYDSFDRYCEVETLEGENQYVAEGHGLQDARKGVLFDGFPAVLQLQLKRFEYDFMKDQMVKINDRYEFPEELDLDAEGGRYLAPGAPRGARNRYRLLAVLVHSGGLHGGHYYAFVRPDGARWLKFDDERVETSSADKAVRDNFGGSGAEEAPGALGPPPLRPTFARFANAYMLVYVRESEWDSVMCAVTRDDIPAHVCARLAAEQAEKERRRREKAEAHLYTLVRVATDADLGAQIGRTRFFDLLDHEAPGVATFKIAKKAPFSALQARVAERLGVPAERQRFWRWAPRQNGTYRPSAPLDIASPDAPISSLRDGRRDARPGTLSAVNLLLEPAVPWPGASPAALRGPGARGKSDALLFFKRYDPATAELRYAGRAFVHRQSRIGELHELMRELAQLPADEPLEVYEEIKFEPTLMVDVKRPNLTVAQSELDDGDILIFQSARAEREAEPGARTAPEFLATVRNRVRVAFKPLHEPADEEGEGGGKEDAEAVEKADGADGTEATDTTDAPTQTPTPTHPPTHQPTHPSLPPGVHVLDLRNDMPYDEVSGALAARLGLDHPLKLALRGQNPYSGLPHSLAQRYHASATLEDMLRGGSRGAGAGAPGADPGALAGLPVLFYEALDLPLPEHERVGTLQVAFHDARGEEAAQTSLRVPLDASVAELLEALRGALPAGALPAEPDGAPAPLRLMEVYQWRIWQLFDPGERVRHVLDGAVWHLRAEVVPPDQRDLATDPEALHVHVLQMSDDAQSRAMAIADPLVMRVREGETVAELGERVRAALGVPPEEFAKWKPVLCPPLAAPEPLEPGDVVAARIPRVDLQRLHGHHDRACVGWAHENKNPRKTHAHLNRSSGAWHGQERALRIKA